MNMHPDEFMDVCGFNPRDSKLWFSIYSPDANLKMEDQNIEVTTERAFDALRYHLTIPELAECTGLTPAMCNFDRLKLVDSDHEFNGKADLLQPKEYNPRCHMAIVKRERMEISGSYFGFPEELIDNSFSQKLKGVEVRSPNGSLLFRVLGRL